MWKAQQTSDTPRNAFEKHSVRTLKDGSGYTRVKLRGKLLRRQPSCQGRKKESMVEPNPETRRRASTWRQGLTKKELKRLKEILDGISTSRKSVASHGAQHEGCEKRRHTR